MFCSGIRMNRDEVCFHSHLAMEKSVKISNPWISKGTKHLFGDSCSSPVNSNPNVLSVQDTGVQKDLFIHSTAKVGETVSESDLYLIRVFLESFQSQIQQMTDEDGKMIDSSVLDGFATIGFVNEGNYCYQNSILQVFIFLALNVVSSSHSFFLFAPKGSVPQVWGCR